MSSEIRLRNLVVFKHDPAEDVVEPHWFLERLHSDIVWRKLDTAVEAELLVILVAPNERSGHMDVLYPHTSAIIAPNGYTFFRIGHVLRSIDDQKGRVA